VAAWPRCAARCRDCPALRSAWFFTTTRSSPSPDATPGQPSNAISALPTVSSSTEQVIRIPVVPSPAMYAFVALMAWGGLTQRSVRLKPEVRIILV
jgi:hypothetical protein